MSWWDFLTLLFGPSRRRNTPSEDTSRLRRAWRWMRATGCLAGVGLLLALMSGSAEAQRQLRDPDSANAMLPHCKRFLVAETGKVPSFPQGVCVSSIATLIVIGGILSDPFRFCHPGVTAEQGVRVVVAYIEARPARMHEDFRVLALEALREAWPC